MTRVIPVLKGADALKSVISKFSSVVSTKEVSSAAELVSAASQNGGVAISGVPLTQEEIYAAQVHTSILNAAPSAKANPDTTYSGASFSIVRSFAASESGSVRSAERIGKFSRIGINVDKEVELVKQSVEKTATHAVELAKSRGLAKVTVFKKPQSTYDALNKLVVEAVKAKAEGTDISVEVLNSQAVFQNVVVFTESLGVVVSPDYSASTVLDGVAAGVAGGNGRASVVHVSDSAKIFARAGTTKTENPTGLLLATAAAFKELGLTAEADKLTASVIKAASSGKEDIASLTAAL